MFNDRVSDTFERRRRSLASAALGFFGPVRWALLISAVIVPQISLGGTMTKTETRKLAKGLPQETEYTIQQAPKKGPCVLIVGGVHGDEPAGSEAARRIAQWPIARGRLVVLPQANVLALAAKKRHTPGVDEAYRDLNRNFPKQSQRPTNVRGELASTHWELVRQESPDWVVDLHEGFDFHQINQRSVGSTVIVFPSSRSVTVASMMIEAVNETIEEPEKNFVPLIRGPVDGSLSRAAAEHLGSEALIAETTNKDQPLETRVRQHEVMVQKLLAHLGMIATSVKGHDRAVVPDAQSARRQPSTGTRTQR